MSSNSYMQSAEAKLGLSEADVNTAGKAAVATGLTVGAYSYFTQPNGAVLIPAIQGAATSFAGSLIAGSKGNMYVALASGGVQYAACNFIEGMGNARCMEYALVTGLLTYGALNFVQDKIY